MLEPQSPGLIKPRFDVPPHFDCPRCETSLMIPDWGRHLYENRSLQCGKCRERITPWEIALHSVRSRFTFAIFNPLGARTTIFSTKLFLNTETRLNLYDVGLPKNARILNINFAPEQLFCMEVSGNSRRQRTRGGRLQLYAFKTYTLRDSPATEGVVGVAVTWVETASEDVAWNNLVAAFDAYADSDFDDAVIPANVAVESKLYRFLSQHLSGVASKERLKDFLDNRATYSAQLNILLPLVTRNTRLPALDTNIRGLLNALRDARNDVAHRGTCDPPLTRERSAELLTAALFGFRYVDFLTQSSGTA